MHPRSNESWRRWIIAHAGPNLIDDMAVELRAQGTTIQPWQILTTLLQRPNRIVFDHIRHEVRQEPQF